jgi:hypothetical protein
LFWPSPPNDSDTTQPLVGSWPKVASSTSSPTTEALSSMNFVGAPFSSPQATTSSSALTIEPAGRWLSFWQVICGMLYWICGGRTETSSPVSVVNGSKIAAVSPVTWLGSCTCWAICRV